KLSMPELRFPGHCFPRAIEFLILFGPKKSQEHNAVYVYGKALCGGLGEHGWVELDDRIVFDGVQQQFYAKQGFYESEGARQWYRFTRPAVLALQRRKDFKGHWHWHVALGLPYAGGPAHPLTVTLEMVKELLAKRGRQQA